MLPLVGAVQWRQQVRLSVSPCHSDLVYNIFIALGDADCDDMDADEAETSSCESETNDIISDIMRDLEARSLFFSIHLNFFVFFQLEENWSSSTSDEENEHLSGEEVSPTSGPIWQLLYFLLIWQSVYRVSNAAMNTLLKFISAFVRVVGKFTIGQESTVFPHTVSRAHSYLRNTHNDDFTVYVVCPKCDSIYEYDDCVVYVQGKKQSKHCKHIAYPNHPNVSRRSAELNF